MAPGQHKVTAKLQAAVQFVYIGRYAAKYKTPRGGVASDLAGGGFGGSTPGITRQALVAQFSNLGRYGGAFVIGFAGCVHGGALTLLHHFLAHFGTMAVKFRLMSAGCHGIWLLIALWPEPGRSMPRSIADFSPIRSRIRTRAGRQSAAARVPGVRIWSAARCKP
jgi:hypothetical protein